MFTDMQRQLLNAPLSAANVKKNPRGYNYVEGWHAIAEANRIFGFDGWDRETIEMVQLGEPEQDGKANWRVAYRCRVRITVRADGDKITRDGTGYGSGIVKDIRDAHESAAKEAETDAMKRALMTFGNPFGLALYDKEQANVVSEPAPKDRYIAYCRETISAADHPSDLKDWWASDVQKNSRREYGLSQSEVDGLMTDLKARLVALATPKPKAA
jgi:Recombination DNA repair protein (RAD52 pathway)